jgi:DASH complex subunit SPC19
VDGCGLDGVRAAWVNAKCQAQRRARSPWEALNRAHQNKHRLHPMSFNSLALCVSSLSALVGLLDESIKTLDDAAHDLARLKRVLSITKVFGLVPELDLEDAKQNIKNEAQPQIGSVLERIRRELNVMERRKLNLAAKIDLQRARLSAAASASTPSAAKGRVYLGQVTDVKLARLRLLQNKRERLRYSLSRHNLQHQREQLTLHTVRR